MIFFFYGEEQFEPEQKVRELKKKFLAKNPTGGGLVVFDCDDEGDNFVNIRQSFGMQNLFAQKKLIVIKNFFANFKAPEQKELLETVKANTSEDVVVFWECGMPRKNAALFVWLKDNAHTVKEYTKLQGSELHKWIMRYVKKCGSKGIGQDALNTLEIYVGNDLYMLSHELEKLCAYAGENIVSREHVEKLVEGKVDGNMFETIEAITSGNKAQALTLLTKQIAAGDDVHYVFSMYGYQIRTLLSVAGEYYDENNHDKNAIAKKVKCHPFVAQKAMTALARISRKQLLDAHHALLAIDRDMKRGKRDMATALEMFLVKF